MSGQDIGQDVEMKLHRTLKHAFAWEQIINITTSSPFHADPQTFG